MIEAYQCGRAASIFLKQNLVIFIFIYFSSYNLCQFIVTTFGCFPLFYEQRLPYVNQNVEKRNTFNNQNDILKSDTFYVHFFTVTQNDDVKMPYLAFYRERN